MYISLCRGHTKDVKCKFSVEVAVKWAEWNVNLEYEFENVEKTSEKKQAAWILRARIESGDFILSLIQTKKKLKGFKSENMSMDPKEDVKAKTRLLLNSSGSEEVPHNHKVKTQRKQ